MVAAERSPRVMSSSLQAAAAQKERAAQGGGCKPPGVTSATLLHVHYPSVLPLSEFLVSARLDDVRRSVRTVILALIVAKWTNDVRVRLARDMCAQQCAPMQSRPRRETRAALVTT